jgi:hypothetical protein
MRSVILSSLEESPSPILKFAKASDPTSSYNKTLACILVLPKNSVVKSLGHGLPEPLDFGNPSVYDESSILSRISAPVDELNAANLFPNQLERTGNHMPVEHAVWKVGNTPERLKDSKLDTENVLEEMIFKDVSILNDGWLLIGRQVLTAYGKFIDLLAVDAQGSIIVIELKKHKSSREVAAQAIDYASWIQSLDTTNIADIFREFNRKYLSIDKSLDEAFLDKFGTKLDEHDLKSSQQVVIVASELDASTERIIKYLNQYDVPINFVSFRVFRDGTTRYLSRAWLIDPAKIQEQTYASKRTGTWNGEYYVSFGHGMGRDWEDARKYKFISAGGGRWYSQTLNLLKEGDRVWVNIPKTGYVGVGIVEAPAVKVDKFKVKTANGEVPLLEAPINASYHRQWVDNEDKAEYIVPVKWLRDLPIDKAISEVGFFGNQNSVCKPTTEKWNHTVERLKTIFKID